MPGAVGNMYKYYLYMLPTAPGICWRPGSPMSTGVSDQWEVGNQLQAATDVIVQVAQASISGVINIHIRLLR